MSYPLAELIKNDIYFLTCEYAQDLEEYKARYPNGVFSDEEQISAMRKYSYVEKTEKVLFEPA